MRQWRYSKAIMKIRIKFLPNEQRLFISNVYSRSKLSTNELAKISGVHPRSFRDWRRGKINMTLFAAEEFSNKFNVLLPEDKNKMIDRWKLSQKEAGRRGGHARFNMYGGFATIEGRRKGGIAAIENLKRNGILPRIKSYNIVKGFNADLAEFVGIMLGDGGLTSRQCTITLNSFKDSNYGEYVSILGYKLFGEKPKVFIRRNESTMILYYNGSLLVRYLLSIGLKAGNKVKQQVGIPGWINTSMDYKVACLRGLMDTDGGIFLHKYKVKGKIYNYKKISFSNRSMPLLFFVKQTLEELGFTPKIIDNVANKKVWLYNMQEVGRYLEVVGTRNNRLTSLFGE